MQIWRNLGVFGRAQSAQKHPTPPQSRNFSKINHNQILSCQRVPEVIKYWRFACVTYRICVLGFACVRTVSSYQYFG